jgi:soluble lytic murein transglycosylase-like protein
MVLPVLTTTVGAAAVIGGVDGTSYIRSAAGVLDRAIKPSSSLGNHSTAYADSALPSPPVFALPKLSSLSRAMKNPITVRTSAASRSKLEVNTVRHPLIEAWVERLTTTHKRSYQSSLTRMDKYDEMISSKLAARKMPQELIYLAMIESNFNPNAKSPVQAVGLWQFMSATARRFGLSVGGRVDERRDPARATDAALTYLSKLYDRFGSWYLAVAAYNSGEGTVLRALRRVTGKSSGTDSDFFRILPALPRETQDYVPKLIASARVGQAPERYGFAMQPAANVLTRTPVTRPKSLAKNRATTQAPKKLAHRKTAGGRSYQTATRQRRSTVSRAN